MKYIPLFLVVLFSSCATAKFIKKELPKSIQEAPAFVDNFTGFMLFDPVEQKALYEYQSDKYFTPASNTKILTLYAAIQLLPNGIPTLSYVEQGDSLIFWGMGNPVFLDERFPFDATLFNFLKNTEKRLIFCDDNYLDERYGAGWAWDDYPYAYQAEKSPFPIYGNLLKVAQKEIYPSLFDNTFRYSQAIPNDRARVIRVEEANTFEYNKSFKNASDYKKYIPFKTSGVGFAQMLADTLERAVLYQEAFDNALTQKKTLYASIHLDSILKVLMHDSDNFIAEQLLLACSAEVLGFQSTNEIIKHLKIEQFHFVPDQLNWRDGSGLSRYNLFTPRTMVAVLAQLHQQLPEERLFNIFPTGGRDGTIKHWYGAEEPYVFAKTGTLSNKHCLSGYIKTKSGRTLIFSFMHNNYTKGSTVLKKEMEKVLRRIWEVY